jgi:anti-sigma regulatory factor (Ser/Thr protein kinase)
MTLEGGERELGWRELPGSSLAPSVARLFIEETLSHHHLNELSETALLLTSEAVTNAVTHAQSPSTLRIRVVGEVVRISVTDAGYGSIVVEAVGPHAAGGGRGLFIIDHMALEWGTRQTDQGTEVWFDLPLPGRT